MRGSGNPDPLIASLAVEAWTATRQANVVVESPTPKEGEFVERLANGDVFGLHGAIFEAPGYIRISLTATMETIDTSAAVLRGGSSGAGRHGMTDSDPTEHDGRLDTMLPGVPLAAKVALLAGLAGGLFAAIVTSYVDNRYQNQVLVAGIVLGALVALLITVQSRIRNRKS